MIETLFTKNQTPRELGVNRGDIIEYYVGNMNYYTKRMLLIERRKINASYNLPSDPIYISDFPVDCLVNTKNRPQVEEYYKKNYYQLYIKAYIKYCKKYVRSI